MYMSLHVIRACNHTGTEHVPMSMLMVLACKPHNADLLLRLGTVGKVCSRLQDSSGFSNKADPADMQGLSASVLVVSVEPGARTCLAWCLVIHAIASRSHVYDAFEAYIPKGSKYHYSTYMGPKFMIQ